MSYHAGKDILTIAPPKKKKKKKKKIHKNLPEISPNLSDYCLNIARISSCQKFEGGITLDPRLPFPDSVDGIFPGPATN